MEPGNQESAETIRERALPGIIEVEQAMASGAPMVTLAGALHQAREGITAEEVWDIAAGAVAGWADGWTGDDGHTPQRRVRYIEGGDGYVDLLVEGARYTAEPDRLFRVTMTVEELEHQA